MQEESVAEMTSTSISTFSFAAGIISPELASNIELRKQGLGMLQGNNLLVTSSGTLSKRPGTQHIASTKGGVCRLIPFVFNRAQGYALEFGENYIRFFRDGGQLISAPSTPVEVATTYTAAELDEIRFTQSADVLYLTHPNHPPAKLTRITDTNWSLDDIIFVPDVEQVLNLALSHTGSITVSFDWEYTVTCVNDLGQEGQPVASETITADIDLADTPITVAWDAPADPSEVKEFRVYRKEGIYFYLVAIVEEDGSANYSKVDSGLQTDNTVSPPENFTDFTGAGNYPTACGFYQQRLVFGGTDNDPNTIWMSRIGDFENFTSTPANASNEALKLKLDSGQVNKISHFKTFDDLICFTEGDIWRIKGTPNVDLLAYVESTIGVSEVDPIKTRKSLLFLEGSKNTVSDFIYSDRVAGYDGNDLGAFSSILFDGYEIKDFTFSDAPEGRLFAPRDDGKMLTLTYLKSQDIAAWTILDTDGNFESVCTVEKSKFDEVYVVVNRNGSRFVEIFKQGLLPTEDAKTGWYVDAGTQYNGQKTTEIVITAGAVVSAVDVFAASNVGDNIRIDETDYEILTYTDPKNVTVTSDLTVTTSDWILTADTFSGLDWLANKTVVALCDGNVKTDLTVDGSGVLTIEDGCGLVTIGLQYEALMETVPVNTISNNFGSSLSRYKRDIKLFVDLYRTRGIEWKTSMEGSEYQALREQNAQFLNSEVPLRSGKTKLDLPNSNQLDGTVFIKNDLPLPFNILNVTMVVDIGGTG